MSMELASQEEALGHVRAAMCRLGPPTYIGAELEWPTAVGGERPSEAQFAAALGPHATGAEHLPLGRGARVSIEPGGQVELSSDVHRGARALCEALAADQLELARILGAGGPGRAIRMLPGAMDVE